MTGTDPAGPARSLSQRRVQLLPAQPACPARDSPPVQRSNACCSIQRLADAARARGWSTGQALRRFPFYLLLSWRLPEPTWGNHFAALCLVFRRDSTLPHYWSEHSLFVFIECLLLFGCNATAEVNKMCLHRISEASEAAGQPSCCSKGKGLQTRPQITPIHP